MTDTKALFPVIGFRRLMCFSYFSPLFYNARAIVFCISAINETPNVANLVYLILYNELQCAHTYGDFQLLLFLFVSSNPKYIVPGELQYVIDDIKVSRMTIFLTLEFEDIIGDSIAGVGAITKTKQQL